MDIASVYTLTPSTGPAVVFNTGVIGDGTDVYFLTNIIGLDSADLRTPQFKRPLTDGGYKPVPWLEDPLHPRFEGAFLIQSIPVGSDCRSERNVMYHALKTCLRNCRDGTGTLEWNEPGIGDLELERQLRGAPCPRLRRGVLGDDVHLRAVLRGLRASCGGVGGPAGLHRRDGHKRPRAGGDEPALAEQEVHRHGEDPRVAECPPCPMAHACA